MSNDWTNKLRDRLTDYQEPVTDDLWAGIQQSLAQQNIEATSAKVIILRRFSIAAALAALAIGGTYIYLTPSQEKENIALATAQEKKEVLDAHSSEGRLSEWSDAQDKSQDAITALSNQLKKRLEINPEMLASHQHDVSENLQDSQIVSEAFQVTPKVSQEDSSRMTSKKLAAPRNMKKLQQDGASEILAMASAYELQETSAPRHKKTSWSVQLYGENGVVGSKNSTGFDMTLSSPNSSSDPMFPGYFDNGFYNTSLLAVRAMSSTPSADFYEKVKHHFPVSVGLQVGFGINDRLRVNTGVVYTRTSSDFINSSYNSSQVTTQTLHYVGIPINVSYDFWKTNRFKTYVTAGGEGDVNVKNHTESDGQEQASKYDRMQWSANAALGAQLDIIPQLGIYVEPGAKYYFDNGSQIENIFKDKKLNFNLQFGLRWNIK